jgi:aconitate hydratase
VSIRLLLENLLRHVDGLAVTEEQVAALARWSPFEASVGEIAFHPARVLLQEFTDVPALLDTARAVFVEPTDADDRVYPETAVGTDVRTPIVNAFGVLAWCVDEHEAAGAMSGQPLRMTVPYVVGVRVTGRLREGVTATDLVLTLAARLRGRGAPGRFVEFCGPGLDGLALLDRVTIASMAPQYGATVAFFPVDALTLDYLRRRGRDEAQVALVEAYAKTQGLFRTGDTPEPIFSSIMLLDLGSVEAPAGAAR